MRMLQRLTGNTSSQKLYGHPDVDFATPNWKYKFLQIGQTSVDLKIDGRVLHYRKIVLSGDIEYLDATFSNSLLNLLSL